MWRHLSVLAMVAVVATGCGSEHQARPARHMRMVSAPWTLLHADGTTLSIVSPGGGCETFGPTHVAETSRSVTIAVYDFVPTGSNVACPAIAFARHLRIILRQLLGARKLIHAPVTPGVSS
jgi:hypothetical protein